MQKRRGWSHLKNTAYVQRKIWQRNIDACPPVVVSLIPKERCSSLPGACIKALAIFELQKETKSKTKQIRGVYSNKISCRQDTKEMGGCRQHIEHPHGQGLLAFCLSLGIVLIPRGSKFIQMKFHGTCLVKKTDSYRFHLSSWTSLTICLKIVLIPRGSKFIQTKFHGTCLVKEISPEQQTVSICYPSW